MAFLALDGADETVGEEERAQADERKARFLFVCVVDGLVLAVLFHVVTPLIFDNFRLLIFISYGRSCCDPCT